jgi:hypothetical protein
VESRACLCASRSQSPRYVHRLSASAQGERAAVLGRTHSVLSETEGEAFEQAMHDARRVEVDS